MEFDTVPEILHPKIKNCIQQFKTDLKGSEGVFQKFDKILKEMNTGPAAPARRSTRSSTMASSAATFAASVQKNSGFPDPVSKWSEVCKSPYKFLEMLVLPCNFKLRLKKKLGFRHEVYRLFDDETIRKSVREMNEKHIEKHS